VRWQRYSAALQSAKNSPKSWTGKSTIGGAMESALAPHERTQQLTGEGIERVLPVAYSLFFVFGSITSLNDVLMPRLRELFTLNYGQMTLVQFCFFTGYFVVSLPASYLIERVGYVRSTVIGLLLMAGGCLLFLPAAASHAFPAFLAALFVVAAGVTIVQVTANPLVVRLGASQGTPGRLTLAHACNSIGTVVAPYCGALLILDAAATGSAMIGRTYAGIALFLIIFAGLVWTLRHRVQGDTVAAGNPLAAFSLLKNPRVRFGVAAMFLYVGAEVTIGSMLINYLALPRTLGMTHAAAAKLLAMYWGGLLVGRLAGIAILRRVSAYRLVTFYGTAAFTLVAVSMASAGAVAAWTMVAVGLCNSIMFPLIFALSSEGLGERTAEGSGLLCVAIVGGALVPLATGHLADITTLTAAMAVPALCYVGIIAFGLYARHPA
jgi:FHS family L-fucose permease-like MFS transporter